MTNQAPQPSRQEKTIGLPPIAEIEVLWITAGLGCDGDTIAMTAATQPSIEEVVLGALPWIPKVNLHNPFLAAANGDDFLRPFHQAAEGKIENFILVVEGSIPNEHNKEEGYWASLGTDPKTGQPIPTCDWIDRLAARAWARATMEPSASASGRTWQARQITSALCRILAARAHCASEIGASEIGPAVTTASISRRRQGRAGNPRADRLRPVLHHRRDHRRHS